MLATEWKTLDLITDPPGKQIPTVRQIRLLKIAVLTYHFFLRDTFRPFGVVRPSRPLLTS